VRPHLKGILYAVIGVLVLSPDSLLIRLVSADTWSIVFWRGLLSSLTLSAWLLARYGRRTITIFRSVGRTGLTASILFAIGNVFFVLAITHTTVANTLVIIGIAPLIAALLSRFVLAEQIPLRTWIAIPVALSGVVLAVSSNLGEGRFFGDLFAVGAAICVGTHMVALRHGRHVDMTPSAGMGAAFGAFLVLPLASPLAISQQDAIYLGILGIGVIAVSFGFIVVAPRYLQAPEVNLLMLIEMIIGPYWVWLALGEEPGARAVVGGCVVLTTLIVHSLIGLRDGSNTKERERKVGTGAVTAEE
jgi:drug/metabolite transporter (DMT)-like permease